MKRASYRHAVAWIAFNDEPYATDLEEIEDFISTLLVAEIFEVESSRVARDIVKHRKNNP